LLLAQLLGSSVELASDNLDGLVGLTLLYTYKKVGCKRRTFVNAYPDDPHRDAKKTGNRSRMTYLQSLTDAEDDRDAALDGSLGLAGNELRGLLVL